MTAANWQDGTAHSLGVFLNGQALGSVDAHGEPIVDRSFLLLLNAHHEDIVFSLPPRRFGPRWQVELSTAYPDAPATLLTARGSAHVHGALDPAAARAGLRARVSARVRAAPRRGMTHGVPSATVLYRRA